MGEGYRVKLFFWPEQVISLQSEGGIERIFENIEKIV